MKKIGSFLSTCLSARSLFVVIITAVIAGSFTATAWMKSNDSQPAKARNSQDQKNDPTAEFWQEIVKADAAAPLPQTASSGQRVEIQARRFRAFSLNRSAMERALAAAPREFTAAARQTTSILALPAPGGGFQRFAVNESPVMEPGLAEKHPDIKTYSGRGLDDRSATIRFDLTPLGFHASVRGESGIWYIDPYYHLDQSAYVSYFRNDLDNPHGAFIEQELDEALISADHSFYRTGDNVKLSGSGFSSKAAVTVTIADPAAPSGFRSLKVDADDNGSFELKFPASSDGSAAALGVTAADDTKEATTTYEVVTKLGKSQLLATGDQLRTYRLALITDPGYATYFGGPANVTAAKVTLINRVDQLYEADISIRLVLVANNDLLNLDNWGLATGPNGPCGAAGCFTQAQVTGCASTSRARFVIGQIIGASNYDIGHLALGEPGGGVASLGVVGRSNKAGGCTGIPTPVGDFYAVDYVAHEMGHQFSGNHPFNGNQLNCASTNRNPATSVEPGSGSSVMAYAGICLTDDLQRHSDPYFSERSQQEIATYTSSTQAMINEVQTGSLVHFGGGNEVQVVTFGPGYAPAFTVRPVNVAINAAPSTTSRGGAEENGNTVTIATGNGHTILVGDTVTIAGVGVAGYNGTWVVTAVPSSRTFQYTNPTAGLATSGGGTVTPAEVGATEVGTTATIRTTTVHGRSVGEVVTVAGMGVAGYNGAFVITAVGPRTISYTATAGLADSGGGTATFNAPFQVRIGGNDSAVIGTVASPYTNANLTSAINAISGFTGTATVTGAAATGFTVTYTGAAAGVDVPNIELVNLNCGGCFSSVQETNHGGANDSFTLNYNGNVSAPIVNGSNYSAAGILAALTPILPAGATATVAGFGGGAVNNTGFQITYTGTLAATNVPVLLAVQSFTAGASGFINETDKGGNVDNKGGTITATGNAIPSVTAPVQFTIPLRTPFALTGSATDGDANDTLTYSWEQNDRGAANGISLLINTKTSGPLFAMFPKSGQISDADSLLYDSPNENHLTTNPTRVFPDLQQILADNTNALTGACPSGPVGGPVPVNINECFAEYLPTTDYVGFAGTNASPPSLHMRLTARDGRGGVDSADTTLIIDNTAGPLRVTSQGSAVTYDGGSTQTVTWNVNNTAQPALAPNVRISFSYDGGLTYPLVLAPSTPNDGSEAVAIPYLNTTTARMKVEAVGNIFFDINHSNFTVIKQPTATTATLGGRITGADGSPLAGALMQLSGGTTRTTITDSNGNYHFDNLTTGNFYTVTPSLVNYHFGPESQSFSLLANKTDAMFTATRDAVGSGNAIDSSGFFVRQHYLDFLGREPDEDGFNFWNNQILSCGADADCRERRTINVSAAYFLSIEFQQTGGMVDGLYRASYGRAPRYAEFVPDQAAVARNVIVGSANWTETLSANKQAFVAAWMERPEFRAAYDGLNNGAYVDALLGHAGAFNGDRATLVSGLNSGALSRAGALQEIVENNGFVAGKRNEVFVMMQYFGYLRRDPDASGYQFWLNKLNQFNGNFEQAEMVKAFIVSGEYRDRFR